MKVEVKETPIRHNGTRYTKGESFNISQDQYKRIEAFVSVLDEGDKDAANDLLDAMEPDELRAYAEDHGIDLGRASSKEGILEKIRAAQN